MKDYKPSHWSIRSTVVLVFLVLVASLMGLFSSSPYSMETQNWLMQARGQDIGNVLAVCVLAFSMHAASKGSQRGFLVWLGTLFYLLYAYIIYAVAVHFNSLFLVYVTVVGITFFTIISTLLRGIIPPRTQTVKRFASYALIVTGLLFALLWLSEIIPAIITGNTPQGVRDAGLWVNPVHVLDLSVVLPSFIATGYLALKRKNIGTYLLTPWLTFSVLMGSSIVAAMLLMMNAGITGVLGPMIMVSVVVAVSALALLDVMRGIQDERTSGL